MNKYFSLVQNGDTADLNIYGDITSWAWEELGEMSANILSKQLEQLENVSNINVYINSYGGEVAEGLAILNALKRHKAKVTTYCDGFACSIASVIFMAGDERVMNEASLLMIHNAWTWASGNAAELRKQADDLETITSASVAAYMSRVNITEEEVREMMDAETWITPEQAVEMGFATSMEGQKAAHESQNARKAVQKLILASKKAENAQYAQECAEGDENPAEAQETASEAVLEAENAENAQNEAENTENEAENGPEDPEEGENADPEDDNEKQSAKMAAFFNAIIK